MLRGDNPEQRKRKLIIYNNCGATIPAFSIVQISSADGHGQYTVIKCNANSQDPNRLIIIGPQSIPDQTYGVGSQDFPLICAFNAGDGTPAVGDNWGAASGDFQLRKAQSGFLFSGNPATGFALVRPSFMAGGSTSANQSIRLVNGTNAQTINSAAGALLSWDNGRTFSTGLYTVPALPGTYLTVLKTGFYQIECSVQFVSGFVTPVNKILALTLTDQAGSTVYDSITRVCEDSSVSLDPLTMHLSSMVQVAANATLAVVGYQDTGNSVTVGGPGTLGYLALTYLGD
jgi:hypothetical protein